MIKLTSSTVKFIPDVTFGDFDNRKADKAEQITVELRMATKAELQRYMGSSFDMSPDKGDAKKGYIDWNFNLACSKNVISVSNLQDKDIDGIELVNLSKQFNEPGDIVAECFLKICGIHSDDTAKKKGLEA